MEAPAATARSRAEIAELRGQAAGNKIAMLQLQTRRREEAVTQLRDQQFRQIDLAERLMDEQPNRFDVGSSGDFGHDSAESGVQLGL